MAYNRKNITQQHLEKRIRALMARLPVQVPVQADALRQIAAMQQPAAPVPMLPAAPPPEPTPAEIKALLRRIARGPVGAPMGPGDEPMPFPPSAPGSELPRGPGSARPMPPPMPAVLPPPFPPAAPGSELPRGLMGADDFGGAANYGARPMPPGSTQAMIQALRGRIARGPIGPGSNLPRGPGDEPMPLGANEMAPPLLPPSPPGIPLDPSMITGVGPGARSRPSPIQPRGPVAPAMAPQAPRPFDRGPVGLPMGPGDASLAPPPATATPSLAAFAAPKAAAASTDPWANLLQFGLALMAGGDVQPGAARGPTFAGALGQAGLSTMGDMRTRAALARKEAKEDAAAAEATRRFGLTYGLSKEELGVKKEQAKATEDLKRATLDAKVQQDKLTNEVAMIRNQIGLANVGQAETANRIRSLAAYETAMTKLIAREDYRDADPPRQKAMRNEVRGRFNQSPEPTRPEDDPAAMAIKEALRKGDIKAEDARKKLKDLGYQ